MVGAPVPDGDLDVFLSLQLSVESPARQIGHFIVRGEGYGDQRGGGRLADWSTKIRWYEPLETGAFFQANDPVLRFHRHESKVEDAEEERDRYHGCPPSREARVANKFHRCHDDVDHQDG